MHAYLCLLSINYWFLITSSIKDFTGQWISDVAIPDCCQQKGKAVALHAKQAQRGGQGTALPILNPGTKGGQLNMTQLLHPCETDTVSTVQESGWSSGPARIGLVNLTPQEFELLTLQYVGSCYSYYAIPPPLQRKPSNIKSSSCWLQLLPTQTLILYWSSLSVKLSSIPSRLCPLHANFLFSLSSNPLQPHHSFFFFFFFFRWSSCWLILQI